jgi:hypothetical protein
MQKYCTPNGERRAKMPPMSAVVRLRTLVDLADEHIEALRMSVSARHEAVLVDGRRLLLADRGWSSGLHGAVSDGADIWTLTPVKDLEETARIVVGPDEPVEGRSRQDAEVDHWAGMANVLHRQGVDVDMSALQQLPHDVVLSERLLARLGHAAQTAKP